MLSIKSSGMVWEMIGNTNYIADDSLLRAREDVYTNEIGYIHCCIP